MLVIMALTCFALLFSVSNCYTFGAFRVLEHDMNSMQLLIERPETLRFIHRVYLAFLAIMRTTINSCYFPTDRITGVVSVPEAQCTVFEVGIYIYIYIYCNIRVKVFIIVTCSHTTEL
jgi:hypothetical protein